VCTLHGCLTCDSMMIGRPCTVGSPVGTRTTNWCSHEHPSGACKAADLTASPRSALSGQTVETSSCDGLPNQCCCSTVVEQLYTVCLYFCLQDGETIYGGPTNSTLHSKADQQYTTQPTQACTWRDQVIVYYHNTRGSRQTYRTL
jgi:hypothetical protein